MTDSSNWVRISKMSGVVSLPGIPELGFVLPYASAAIEDSRGNKQVGSVTYCADGSTLRTGLSGYLLGADIEAAVEVLKARDVGFAFQDAAEEGKFYLGSLPSPLQQRCDEGDKSTIDRLKDWLTR